MKDLDLRQLYDVLNWSLWEMITTPGRYLTVIAECDKAIKNSAKAIKIANGSCVNILRKCKRTRSNTAMTLWNIASAKVAIRQRRLKMQHLWRSLFKHTNQIVNPA